MSSHQTLKQTVPPIDLESDDQTPTQPQRAVQSIEVGGRLLLALSEPGDRLVLLPSCADPSLVQLDAGSVDALILALVDARARMAAQVSTSA